jgi:hypothetical protein
MKLTKCYTCKNELFKIINIPCCDECSENAAWDPEELAYTTDIKLIDEKELDRCQVEDDGECQFSHAYGAGCKMFICSECGRK